MSETRVIAPQVKIGARPQPGGPPAAAEPAEAESPQPKRKWLSIVVGLVLLGGAFGAYWFVMGPGAGAAEGAAAPVEEVELGSVQSLEAISINLSGGHYLRLGLGLQLGADAHGEVDGAAALDAAIGLFSGLSKEDLADPQVRDDLKQQLLEAVEEPYHGEVLGIYYTDFVTQ